MFAIAPENPQFSVFGTARVNTPARQILVDDQNLAYSIGMSRLSVIPVFPTGTAPRPADAATATSIPAPTVLGGSCVVMNELPLPLIHTSDGRISAQIPEKRSGGCDYSAVRRLQFLVLWKHTVLPHEPDN